MRQKITSWQQLEVFARIRRNRPESKTPADAERMERKILSSWGRPRRKYYGPK